MKNEVIWTPQPKQRLMLSRGEDEGFYGGAAGGGKSDYLVIEAVRQVELPNYRGLILRKTVPELEQLIERAREYYSRLCPEVKFNDTKHTFTFPSGAIPAVVIPTIIASIGVINNRRTCGKRGY